MIFKALVYGLFITVLFMMLNAESKAEQRLYPTSPNTWATQDRTTEIDPAVAKELHDMHVENERLKQEMELNKLNSYNLKCEYENNRRRCY